MVVQFSSNLTIRKFNWSDWKLELAARNSNFQFDESLPDYYQIWFYDSLEVFSCVIWKSTVPDDIITSESYTQEQNDLDQTDFLDNYYALGNKSIQPSTIGGVIGHAPAKGLGGFVPDPKNNPYEPDADEVVSLYADGEGSLVTRGAVLTDEGSYRDDFTGTDLVSNLTGTISFTNGSNIITGSGSLFTQELNRNNYVKLSTDDYTKWIKILRAPNDTTAYLDDVYTGSTSIGTGEKTRWVEVPVGSSPGDVTVSTSKMTISSSTDSTSGVYIYSEGDYLPIISNVQVSCSQRIDNQSCFFGLRDSVLDPKMYCDVVLDGTDGYTVKFRTAWDGDEELSVITLSSETSLNNAFKIDASQDYCALIVNNVLVAKHKNHIPDMYSDMMFCAGIINDGSVTNTDLVVDSILFFNQNKIQITSSFAEPLPIIVREDQHSIYGKLITSSTSADQVILSYTVPSSKTMFLIGYKIDSAGTLTGSPIKIGKNSVTTEPTSPGSLDSNIFRCFDLPAGNTTGDVDLSGNPRKIGNAGDVVKITVTPSGSLSSTWRASLDFVLR